MYVINFQTQSICVQVIKDKIRREGLLTKKISISIEALPNLALRSNVFIILNRTALELERINPRTFSNITLTFSEAENAPVLVEGIGRALLKHDVTWGRIISFLTISSTLSCDCVRHGQLDVIPLIVDSACSVIFEEAGSWIEREGGWKSLESHVRPSIVDHLSVLDFLSLLTGFLLTVHLTFMLLKIISHQITNIL